MRARNHVCTDPPQVSGNKRDYRPTGDMEGSMEVELSVPVRFLHVVNGAHEHIVSNTLRCKRWVL